MSDPTNAILSQDVAFDLLSNARRRFVLRRLQERSGEIELGELAAELAAKENDIPVSELSSQQRKRTYVSLYQTHIPKMVESGVITYDRDAGMVAPTKRVNELSSYFRSGYEQPAWELLYGAVAALGLLVYLAIVLVEIPSVNAFYVGLLTLVGIVVLSLVHRYHTVRSGRTDGLVPLGEK